MGVQSGADCSFLVSEWVVQTQMLEIHLFHFSLKVIQENLNAKVSVPVFSSSN